MNVTMADTNADAVAGQLDNFSDGEFEELGPRSMLLKPPKKLGYQIDGEVPDVVYTLNHIGITGRFLGQSRSQTPFARVTSYEIQHEGTGKDGEPLEKPVLEIVTTVCIEGRPEDNRRPHYPRRVAVQRDRPITSAFDNVDYRSDGYVSEDEQYVAGPGSPELEVPYMIIYSEHLINALRAVTTYYPGIALGNKTVYVNAPYRILHHHRQELVRYRDSQPAVHSAEYAATTSQDIDVLLGFLDGDLGSEISREEERHRLETPTATFDLFWLLLKPGEVIYTKRYDIWTPYVISSVAMASRGGRSLGGFDSYRISCWLLESNGVKIGRFMESCSLPAWLGEQAISSLPVVPAAFWVDSGREMRAKLVDEGRLYWELLKRPTYMEYDGLLVSSGSGNRQPGGPTGFMCGRVICDASGFDKFYDMAPDFDMRRFPGRRQPQHGIPPKDHLPVTQPRCACSACTETLGGDGSTRNIKSRYADLEGLDPLVDTPPDDELFFLVLSKTVPGFILGTRRWGNLHVANLSPVNPDVDAFKYLVLDDDIKLTVRALISHLSSNMTEVKATGEVTPWGNDFVRNKGEGRIFLLHGAPGVGKTCTAECIAELTNRPLISLTSGDLGVDSFRPEANLRYFLELGQRYGALVLLDEADVYLERRRPCSIARNSLVSIFLRALEYYRGVLFLTTNRVSSFDTAFLSRIHVALHYRDLTDEDRDRIWTHTFDRLVRDSRGVVRVTADARRLVGDSKEVRALRWNGREIRNAMQTALALAESQARDDGVETVTVHERHVRAVVKLSRGFKEYIKANKMMEQDGDGDGDDEEEEDQYR